ncbi:MAG: septum site-determining protein MinD [Oscillospiraceae bacterium]|nr:septum site-determining protein MinD [Oscillospiraceae bacterium]
MGQVIAVVSGKGGTGKTSFTANVGMALAQMGHPTLCLDCDVGLRNLDILLAMTDRAMMDFTDVMTGRCTLEEAAVQHPLQKNLYLLTAPARIGTADIRREDFRGIFPEIRERFDYCLVDAPAGLGAGFQLALVGADRAVVVTTTEESSLRDAQRTVMELHNMPSGCLHLIVNRCKKKLLRSLHQTIDDAIDKAGLPLLGVVPEDETMPLYAGRGTPLLMTNNDCAAKAYRNIARRIDGQRVRLMKIR